MHSVGETHMLTRGTHLSAMKDDSDQNTIVLLSVSLHKTGLC